MIRSSRRPAGWGAGRWRRAVQGLALLGGAAAGMALGGPVAAAVAGGYAAIGSGAWCARVQRRSDEQASARAVEAVSMLAAELRAGGGASQPDVSVVTRDATFDAAAWRVSAACQISERLGAPLADLLDRVDADLRSGRRLRLAVDAQTSGCRATSLLLAALPVAGLALGAAMGADPVHQLLHTRLGAACALAALVLQVLGLGWTSVMIRAVRDSV